MSGRARPRAPGLLDDEARVDDGREIEQFAGHGALSRAPPARGAPQASARAGTAARPRRRPPPQRARRPQRPKPRSAASEGLDDAGAETGSVTPEAQPGAAAEVPGARRADRRRQARATERRAQAARRPAALGPPRDDIAAAPLHSQRRGRHYEAPGRAGQRLARSPLEGIATTSACPSASLAPSPRRSEARCWSSRGRRWRSRRLTSISMAARHVDRGRHPAACAADERHVRGQLACPDPAQHAGRGVRRDRGSGRTIGGW
jgi:hypothetical protein